MEEIKCDKCNNNWFRTACIHENETGTRCTNCNRKINIDWSRIIILDEHEPE